MLLIAFIYYIAILYPQTDSLRSCRMWFWMSDCIIFFVAHFVDIHVKLHELTSTHTLKVQSRVLHLYLFWFQWLWLFLSITGEFTRNTGMVAWFCRFWPPPPPPPPTKKKGNKKKKLGTARTGSQIAHLTVHMAKNKIIKTCTEMPKYLTHA